MAWIAPHRDAWLKGLLLIMAALLPLSGLHAAAAAWEQERELFAQARQALLQGQHARAEQLAAELQDYPLSPYLQFWRLERNLAQQSATEIQDFLDAYAETPLAVRLRFLWLQHLGREKRWAEYLQFYTSSRRGEFLCYYHTALLESGQRKEAFEGARVLWLVGHSQHQACDPLFAAWQASGGVDASLRWQRIELAMAAGNANLANFLARGLSQQEQALVQRWRELHNHPRRIATSRLPDNDRRSRVIALHAMVRLANSEPEQAEQLLARIGTQYGFDESDRHQVIHAIAQRMAIRGLEPALAHFAQLPAEVMTETSRAWAVRVALRNGRWQSALAWLEAMPEEELNSDIWSYWLARVYQLHGREQEAYQRYREVSRSRTYYGFLAADRIGVEYNFSHEALHVDEQSLARLKSDTAVQRAGEFYRLGMLSEARAEWEFALARMDDADRIAAGKVAARWEWHDRALLSLARARHFDDLEIRFPLAFGDVFLGEAGRQGLDPSWVFAVARQESAMDPMARSPVGALGLMQVMPATGREIARQLRADVSDRSLLLQPETNIRFGAHYLRQMLDRFDNPVLATAAYNAGPHRVQRWIPEEGVMDADIWVETIPFNETRDYLRRVMAYTIFYDMRLQRPMQRLATRLPPVGRAPVLIAMELDGRE